VVYPPTIKAPALRAGAFPFMHSSRRPLSRKAQKPVYPKSKNKRSGKEEKHIASDKTEGISSCLRRQACRDFRPKRLRPGLFNTDNKRSSELGLPACAGRLIFALFVALSTPTHDHTHFIRS